MVMKVSNNESENDEREPKNDENLKEPENDQSTKNVDKRSPRMISPGLQA
jgi:hypothetical protein